MCTRQAIRAIWITFINTLAIYLAVYGSSEVREVKSYLQGTTQDSHTLLHYFRGLIPGLGILLEWMRSRWASYINVGYFIILASFFGILAAYNWSDFQSRAYLLILCIATFSIAVINFVAYRFLREHQAN